MDVNKEDIKKNALNDNEKSDILFKEEMENDKDSSCESDFKDPSVCPSADNLTDQQKDFIKMCKQEFDKDKLPNDFDLWSAHMQFDHLLSNIEKYFPNIPESLTFILPAIFKDGDCGRPVNEKPDWLDMNKFHQGQQFALRYFSMISISGLLGLLQIFSFEDGLKPLILSQKSNTPHRAFTRYLSTIKRFRSWYMSDPWCEGTPAYQEIQNVRQQHRAMRQKLCNWSDEQIDQACEIPQVMCPMLGTIKKDFMDSCPVMKNRQCPYTMLRMKGLNQGDMSGTQFACMGLIVLYPEQLGVHNASDEDLEAFCHLWRGLGYLLGIEDQYNFCQGSLQDVRQRSKDFIEYWVKPNFRNVQPEWEHMIISLYEGVDSVVYLYSYKVFLLILCDMINLNMPRLHNSISFFENIMHKSIKFLFLHLSKLPIVTSLINRMIHTSLDNATEFKSMKHTKLMEKSHKIVSNHFINTM